MLGMYQGEYKFYYNGLVFFRLRINDYDYV